MGIATFASNCKTLKKFSCSSCALGAKSINALLKNSSTLEELSLKGLRGVIAGTEPIVPGVAAASLKSILLKDLVDGLSLTPLIMGSKNLKALKIIRCQGNWDELFQFFGHGNAMASLIEVHIERIQVSDCGVSAISNCLNLEILHLIKVWDCSNFGLASIAEHCKRLRKLHIDGWRINRIGDEGLIAIAKQCLDLQELVLIGVNPTCLSLSLLASNCVNLERLALCGSRVGDEEIACIAAKCNLGCPNLAKIKVKKCRGVTGEIKEWLVEKRTSLSVNWDVEEIDHLDASSSDAGSGQEVAVPETRLVETGGEAPVVGDRWLTILKTTLSGLSGRSLMACTFGRWPNSPNGSSSRSI
ncbi:F-box protein, partial [Cucurbita argyrosperma subsp. sororia]